MTQKSKLTKVNSEVSVTNQVKTYQIVFNIGRNIFFITVLL